MGGEVNISYESILALDNAVDPGVSAYPLIADGFARRVVTELQATDGLGTSMETAYDYMDSRRCLGQPHKRVWLGFASVKRTDKNTGSFEISYYTPRNYCPAPSDIPGEDQEIIYLDLRGLMYKQEIYGNEGGSPALFIRKQYAYSAADAYNQTPAGYHKVKKIFCNNKIVKNFNGGNK